MADRYEPISCGNIGEAKLARDNKTKQLVALKYIQRGEKIDEVLEREIINHRSFRHPNIIGFKEVFLTPTHLTIVMEYADGGELFKNIRNAGRFSENEARSLFQQLILGVSYCHSMEIYHKDLKLENTYLVCLAFGSYMSDLLPLQPRSKVRTPAYIAPEVLSHKEYDKKIADVWSCGVTLYVMLVGAYPFEDPIENNRNFHKQITRIMSAQYSIPDDIHVSEDCRHILSSIFVVNPLERITVEEIKNHSWFLKSLTIDVVEYGVTNYQSVEEIIQIIDKARTPDGQP